MNKRVTLHGISAEFDPGEIESLVRTAGEMVCGDGDLDSLSERQHDLARRAYDLLVIEWDEGPPSVDLSAARTDQGRYQLFRNHADTYGVQVTWADVYTRLRSGDLRMAEETLLAFLGAYLTGYRRYHRSVDEPSRCELATARVDDLRDGDLFSLDNGSTWHLFYQFMIDVVSIYHGAGRGDDATFARIPAATGQPCLVARLPHAAVTARSTQS